ncbi:MULTISPECIES: Arc family DNA-binding protein [unclassified Mesorhizobium]|uniref:Arc family DNA-binding protein n=1 Tax=unclassified Mesorhizobium TaxID=325217 RepID=UPI003015428B
MMEAQRQLKIRLPFDAKAFIEAEARENASSQNSEIVRAIRAAMKAKSAASAATDQHDVTSQPL